MGIFLRMKENQRILIICVNHQSNDALLKYIESIRNADMTHTYVDVHVLDNSDFFDQHFYEGLDNGHDWFGEIKVFPKENRGYFLTAQMHLEDLSSQLEDYDYFVVSNVDVWLSRDFFVELRKVPVSKSIGILAPTIQLSNGLNKNPKIVSRITRKKLKINRLFFSSAVSFFVMSLLNLIRVRLRTFLRREASSDLSKKIIYAAHGSFILFTPKGFDVFKSKKYPVFLFGEEIFLAEELLKIGLQTVYLPSLKVGDSQHSSTSLLSSSRYRSLNIKAINYLMSEYFEDTDHE